MPAKNDIMQYVIKNWFSVVPVLGLRKFEKIQKIGKPQSLLNEYVLFFRTIVLICTIVTVRSLQSPNTTGWERTGQMLCIVDTSLSVLMTLRMCLRELCCRLDLNHLVRVFYLFMFS